MIEYEMAAIGAAVIAAVFIWHQIRTQKQIHAIDTRVARMQKELDVLHVQESRRTMMAVKSNSKMEAPRIESCDDGRSTLTAATSCG